MKVFVCYNIKHIRVVSHSPTGQTVVEKSNCTLKEMLSKYKWVAMTPIDRLHIALLTYKFLNSNKFKRQQLPRDIGLWEKYLLN